MTYWGGRFSTTLTSQSACLHVYRSLTTMYTFQREMLIENVCCLSLQEHESVP